MKDKEGHEMIGRKLLGRKGLVRTKTKQMA